VIDRAFDHPLEAEEHATASFAGGIKQHGYQCGMVWGAALAAGAQAYQLYGAGSPGETRAVMAAQRLVESFRTQNKAVDCIDITDIDKSSSTWQMITFFLLKGGSIGCFRMAARYAPVALSEVNSTFSDENIEAPPAPVSCAAILAQKMDVSDMHTVMAAGLAGGIGLCGGACGALGAAIWIMGMRLQAEQSVKNLWNDEIFTSKFDELMDRFLKSSDYEFECSKIVGRQFENVNDHSTYVRDGGCSNIIEALAAG
jgi:hypothetical protein